MPTLAGNGEPRSGRGGVLLLEPLQAALPADDVLVVPLDLAGLTQPAPRVVQLHLFGRLEPGFGGLNLPSVRSPLSSNVCPLQNRSRTLSSGVFELPFRRGQSGLLGRLTGGWQVSGFLTFQAGAPFTVLNGVDPRGRTAGNVVGTPTRPDLNTALDLSSMTVREVQAAGGGALFRGITAAHPTGVGNAGRNILRADGINRLDLGVIKNMRVREGRTLRFHANFFNLTNTRDWGIPDAVYSSPSFLLEGPTDGGNRRVMLGLRFVF